ncbi:MAG: TetR/AcrR family transcriptional regulator C-terminal domain-containing protein, partial [Myxococcota bacterium]
FETGVPTTANGPDELRDLLVQYGEKLLEFLNEAEIIQFARLMHEEARTHPDVARTFYEAAYGRSHAKLSALIKEGIDAGYVQSTLTAADLAEQLLGMWESLRYVRAQLALTDRPYGDPRTWSEKCVITLFGDGAFLSQSTLPSGRL